jgi:ABC-2 type transport system permease protein
MRVVLSMVAKDLRRRLRSPLPTLLLLIFPLIFAGLIALTFGGGDAGAPKVRLLVEDRDGGLVGRFLLSALGQEEVQKHVEMQAVENVGSDVGALLERQQAAALLRLPAGLSADFVAGRPARLELIRSPAQSILPDVAEQLTTVMAEVLSSSARLLRGPLDQIRAARLPQGAGGGASDREVARIAVLANGVVSRARPYLLPPVVQLAATTLPAPGAAAGPRRAAGAPPRSNSLFLLFLPGISVFSLFSLADQMMRDVLVEARQKTLRRQLAGPLGAGRVLVAKALATAALAGLSLVFLTVLGALLAPRGVDLAGYLLLSLALVIATTGFASAMYGAARNERQGATLAAVLSLVMAFAGGAFIPLDSLPGLLRSLSPFSLIYWATRGYQRLVVNGEGLAAVLPNVAILAGVGALLLAVSAPLWQRRLLRGELQ